MPRRNYQWNGLAKQGAVGVQDPRRPSNNSVVSCWRLTATTGIALLLSVIASTCTHPYTAPLAPDASLEERARTLIEQLAHDDFNGAAKQFSETFRGSMPANELKRSWRSVISQSGAFDRIRHVQTVTANNGKTLVVTCLFAKTQLDVQIAFNANREITNLRVRSVGAPVP